MDAAQDLEASSAQDFSARQRATALLSQLDKLAQKGAQRKCALSRHSRAPILHKPGPGLLHTCAKNVEVRPSRLTGAFIESVGQHTLWLSYSCDSLCSSSACPELHANELLMSPPRMWHAASTLLATAVPEFVCYPAFSRSSVCCAGNAGLEASHWDALLNMAWCPVLTVCPEEGEHALVCTVALC